ncbi:hypothetical protein PanWU01x14_143120 [Parasponia andersonii]|uniref:Uncharacterized protein n=1 Tax=Parasponia andersonii TaxID=3476 RepID=A0A2P5CKR9_PARAD|nr:hypothetical protein PanWU01x14_143120 [Parasponia andersonii]
MYHDKVSNLDQFGTTMFIGSVFLLLDGFFKTTLDLLVGVTNLVSKSGSRLTLWFRKSNEVQSMARSLCADVGKRRETGGIIQLVIVGELSLG